ncbi:response regulator [Paenibacillus solisilvae]|uniref:Response regulator n=1 Tax=Paenibacillus solisilvae TaxID=2486751 RepID=A0ABW0VUF4_9BACL
MCRVLLVDDEFIARVGLRTTFDWEGNGYKLVGEAANGLRAMKWIENREVDILITDIAMPVMDGLELVRRTRELCPWVKVLLLSCHSDFDYVREGIRLGASDYILKPTLNSDSLKTILDSMREKLQEEQENRKLLDKYREQQLAEQQEEQEKPMIPAIQGNERADRSLLRVEASFNELPAAHDTGIPDITLHQRIVMQAVQFMTEHFIEPISLQQVADEVNVSRNYFSEIFKKVTGTNFIDYLITLRVNRAKELLAASTLRVYEVAEQSGFNDVKHFSKQFKKIVGLSPAEFHGHRAN